MEDNLAAAREGALPDTDELVSGEGWEPSRRVAIDTLQPATPKARWRQVPHRMWIATATRCEALRVGGSGGVVEE